MEIHKLIKGRVTISEAITAMCNGLEKQEKRKDFEIDMETFGELGLNKNDEKICCGCAANSAIQEISGINFTTKDINMNYPYDRADYLGFGRKDLEDFELAINSLRKGKIAKLFDYYEIKSTYNTRQWLVKDLKFLETSNWKGRLTAYRMLAKDVKKFENDNEKIEE